ncbi:MAG: integrase family protein [Deferribacteraceae bacterium]|nr:integrase family protein [Deferribacteraceae bacterium]
MRKTVKVRTDKGKLLLDFYYKNVRCREYLGIENTKQNWRFAERLASEIEQKILLDTLDYVEYFPESKKLELFGISRKKEYLFSEYANKWYNTQLKKYEASLISKSTLKQYEYGINKIKLTGFYFKKVDDIKKKEIEEFIIDLKAKGLKSKSINNILTPIRLIFNSMYEEELVNDNIMLKIKNIRQEKVDIDPFNREEVLRFLEYSKNKYPETYPLIATMVFTGMRVSEVLGMKWENIDFNDNTYTVKSVIVKGEIKETTKTVESKRVINLPDILVEILKKHKTNTFLKSEFVFLNRYNNPFTKTANINKVYWKPMLNKLGIRYREIRQLRHTHAILSILAGDNPHDIAKRLGHSNLLTFFNRYAKYLKDYQNESKLQNYIFAEYCQNLNVKNFK